MQKLPSQQYLDSIFKKLDKAKHTVQYKEIPIGSVYKGFKSIPIQKLESKKVPDYPQQNGEINWIGKQENEIYYYKESCPMNFGSDNGFFQAFYKAYINHGDVKITPDDVWAAIMLYFSKYADDNAEKLTSAFVNHEGKKRIIIKTFSQTKQERWNLFFEKLAGAFQQRMVHKVAENFQCSFTTTDQFFRFFSTAVIMNSSKKYFDFTHKMCVCGIQNIHMGGCLQDWQKVSKKLAYLKQFDVNGGLKKYVERLLPVIDQFIQTFKGQANLEFWNNLYHEREDPQADAYQPKTYANGWILRFFTTSDYFTTYQYFGESTVAIQSIDVPVQLINGNKQENLNLVGGCRGVSVQNNVYRPHFSFAVVKKGYDRRMELSKKSGNRSKSL